MTQCAATSDYNAKRCRMDAVKGEKVCARHRSAVALLPPVVAAEALLAHRAARQAERASREQVEAQYRAVAEGNNRSEGAHGRRRWSVSLEDGGDR